MVKCKAYFFTHSLQTAWAGLDLKPENKYHKICFWFLVVVMHKVIVSSITWTEKSFLFVFFLCNFQDLLNGIPSWDPVGALPYKEGRVARHTIQGLKSSVGVSLGVKPLKVHSGSFCCTFFGYWVEKYDNWYLLGVEKIPSHTHKNWILVPLYRGSFENFRFSWATVQWMG